jgi:hypothetical protein
VVREEVKAMSPFWRWILGLEEGEVPAGGESRWELAGLPHGSGLLLALAVAAAALLLIVVLYRRERELKPLRRAVLTGLRLGALALVVLILLDPQLLTEIHLKRPGTTFVLVDTSASMAQRDELEGEEGAAIEAITGFDLYEKPSRAALAAAALERLEIVPRLARANRVALYTFAAEARRLASLADLRERPADGEETRLGDALRAVLAEARGEPVAAVAVISDGRQNAGLPLADAARELALERRAPVHTVAVGKERVPRNLAVRELVAPPVVEVGFPVQIEAAVALSGIREPVTAKLSRTARDGGERIVIEERRLEPAGPRLEARLKFIDKLPRKGTYRYTLELPRLDGETDLRDNRRETFVQGAEEKCRLLLVSGNATSEYRFLRNFLIRDEGIQVSCWLSSADRGYPQDGNIAIRGLPQDAEELREYDVVVLLDPDPDTLTATFQAGLAEFVSEQGGGLIYVSGEAHAALTARDGARFRPLLSLLPVDLAAAPAPLRPELHTKPWRPRLTPAGEAHPLCRLQDDRDQNLRLWSELPPFYYAYPAEKLKPAALELLRADAGHVLAALQRVGLGESIYLGSDDFWRWRAAVEGLHERFWAGLVRYLAAGKRQAGTRQVTVETDRDRYRQGDPVRITVYLVDAQRRPLEVPRLAGAVKRRPAAEADGEGGSRTSLIAAAEPQEWPLSLTPVPGTPGRYTALFRAPIAGHFEVGIDPEGEAAFEVERISSELEDPTPDYAALAELAQQSGGRFFTLPELGSLPDVIPETSITEVLGRRAVTVWDSAALMLLFSAFLILEWILRKLWSLN